MKAYERLNVEVVKFEAQDVITASVAECICKDADPDMSHVDNNGHRITKELNGQKWDFTYCPATEHHDCPEDPTIA